MRSILYHALLGFFLVIITQSTLLAQDSTSRDTTFLLSAYNENLDTKYFVQNGDKIKATILEQSVKGEVTSIKRDSIQIDSLWFATADITQLKDISFRNSKRSTLILGVVASAVLTAGSIILLTNPDDSGQRIFGILGTVIGVPLLGRSVYRMFTKFQWKTADGWTFDVEPHSEDEDEDGYRPE